MTRTYLGKVHGKSIELEEDMGVADGQPIEVEVRIVNTPTSPVSAGQAKAY